MCASTADARSQMGEGECAKVKELADLYRQRLFDLYWFMRVVNESLAPVVSPEVADEIALLPAQELPVLLSEAELSALPEAPLMPFDTTSRFEQAVPFGLEEYLELVDTMGRAVHPAKRVFEAKAA